MATRDYFDVLMLWDYIRLTRLYLGEVLWLGQPGICWSHHTWVLRMAQGDRDTVCPAW